MAFTDNELRNAAIITRDDLVTVKVRFGTSCSDLIYTYIAQRNVVSSASAGDFVILTTKEGDTRKGIVVSIDDDCDIDIGSKYTHQFVVCVIDMTAVNALNAEIDASVKELRKQQRAAVREQVRRALLAGDLSVIADAR